MVFIEEPQVATDTAGEIIEGIDPLRSEPEEVVDAATGFTGTKPIVEQGLRIDCIRGGGGYSRNPIPGL